MSSSMVLAIVVLIAALGVAYVVGRLITLRAGLIRAGEEAADIDTSGLGLSHIDKAIVFEEAGYSPLGPVAPSLAVVTPLEAYIFAASANPSCTWAAVNAGLNLLTSWAAVSAR